MDIDMLPDGDLTEIGEKVSTKKPTAPIALSVYTLIPGILANDT